MADPWHVEWLKEGVAAWNKRRKRVDFVPDLSELSFFSILPEDFRENPKASRYFEKINLAGADLRGADLSGLNFKRGNFENADMRQADLSKSNFSFAKLLQVDLSAAKVERTVFDRAILERVQVFNTNITSADLEGAVMIDIRLKAPDLQKISTMPSTKYFATRADYRLSLQGSSPSAPRQVAGDAEDKRSPKDRYDVIFATNRSPVVQHGKIVSFEGGRDEEVRYGLCEVIAPKSRPVGSLGSPLWKRIWNRKDDRLSIGDLITLNESLLREHLKSSSHKMKVKEHPTIYVHGFNTTFEAAVLRAAQLGLDLGIGQGIGLFSWPSRGNPLYYKTDEAACESSKYSLADFIELFSSESSTGKINIIAHSMGCRCTLGALEVLTDRRRKILKTVNQIILCAADVDTAIMPKIAGTPLQYCARATSYVSDRDKALRISGWYHSFPRVGITPPTFVMNGLDTVQVNNLDLGFVAHAYGGSSRSVLSDIFDLLKHNLPPAERKFVEPVLAGADEFWRIKD